MVSVGIEDLCLHREEITKDGEGVRDEIDVAAKANGWWRVKEEDGGEEEREADAPEK
jgi:hypothetical protein